MLFVGMKALAYLPPAPPHSSAENAEKWFDCLTSNKTLFDSSVTVCREKCV